MTKVLFVSQCDGPLSVMAREIANIHFSKHLKAWSADIHPPSSYYEYDVLALEVLSRASITVQLIARDDLTRKGVLTVRSFSEEVDLVVCVGSITPNVVHDANEQLRYKTAWRFWNVQPPADKSVSSYEVLYTELYALIQELAGCG